MVEFDQSRACMGIIFFPLYLEICSTFLSSDKNVVLYIYQVYVYSFATLLSWLVFDFGVIFHIERNIVSGEQKF